MMYRYANGMCPTAADGTKLPCPEGYGAILGTAALCALLEIGLSFMKPTLLKRLFPPIVTGPTVTLIGVSLIQSGLQYVKNCPILIQYLRSRGAGRARQSLSVTLKLRIL